MVTARGRGEQDFPASADLKDAVGQTVVTSYVVKRPDANWSLMLINHDLNAAHPVRLVIDDAKHVSHPFIGSVALVQYANNPAGVRRTSRWLPQRMGCTRSLLGRSR